MLTSFSKLPGRPVGMLARCMSAPSVPPMPECDFKPAKYSGPSYSSILQKRKEFINPGMLTYYKKPVAICQGHKQWLFDIDGNRYLDMFAGIATVIVGHCHPRINEAVFKQMETLWHTTNIYAHPQVHLYCEKLASKLPGELKVVYLVNSGSEANDMAQMMARLYTGCMDLLALRGCYHGMSPITMGITSLSTWNFNYPGASVGVHKVRNADPYRGPWGGSACRDSPVQTDRSCSCAPGTCEASIRYAEEVDDVLRHCTPKEKVAGLIIESIQGVNGAVQFPKGYVKRAFEAIRAKGGLCISDEVQTGFGRTGENYWGFQDHGVIPDIVTLAKGIGNGFPMAAVVTTPKIASVMARALHFNTFGGNPMASVTGSTVIDIIDDEKLQQNAANVGTHILNKLSDLRREFEVVGDVRGKGLMIGIELVKNKTTRTPLPIPEVADIFESCKDNRVLLGKGGLFGSVLRVKPPLCITKEDADYCLAVLRHALYQHSNTKY